MVQHIPASEGYIGSILGKFYSLLYHAYVCSLVQTPTKNKRSNVGYARCSSQYFVYLNAEEKKWNFGNWRLIKSLYSWIWNTNKNLKKNMIGVLWFYPDIYLWHLSNYVLDHEKVDQTINGSEIENNWLVPRY